MDIDIYSICISAERILSSKTNIYTAYILYINSLRTLEHPETFINMDNVHILHGTVELIKNIIISFQCLE